MENKTKQDIKVLREDVDHIKQSFYADLEAYYGNTKIIDDFQDISKWTAGTGIQSSDTTNIKIDNQALKITENDNSSSFLFSTMQNTSLDLTTLNNGETSTDDDYINFVVYISDVGKVNLANGLILYFGQDTLDPAINNKYKVLNMGLVTGWNFFKIKKSDFLVHGTGKWSDIKSVRVLWQSLANAQNAYVSFQLIQLVKADPDTLIDIPNPFQKFGVTELQTVADLVVVREFGDITIKSLGNPTFAVNPINYKKTFTDVTVYTKVKANSVNVHLCGLNAGGNLNVLSYIISGVLSLRKIVPASTTITTPFIVSAGDIVESTLEKKGSNCKLTVTNLSTRVTAELNIDVNEIATLQSKPSFYSYTADTVQNILAMSATEITHAHHCDIAENLSENGKVDLLRTHKSISQGNKIFQLGTYDPNRLFNLYAKMLRHNLHNGSCVAYSDLFLGRYGANFSLQGKMINLVDLTTEQYKTRIVVTDTNKIYSISPLYSNASWVLLDKNNFTEDIQEVSAIDGNIVWDSDNNTTKIALQQTPVETVITSGFASGWTGEIRVSKTQEGILLLNLMDLMSTTDFSTTLAVVLTLPVGFRPTRTHRELVVGLTSVGAEISGTLCEILYNVSGAIQVRSLIGANTGLRRITNVQSVII